MARIISLCNQKGGVGKSTSAQNLAVFLAALGKRVLLVDIDPQANATSGLGINTRRLERDIYHALIGKCSVDAVLKKTKFLSLDILPASSALAGATIELVDMRSREYKLRELLEPVRRKYDFIIIDSPPSLGLLTINALTASRSIIIPVQCEYYALEGLADLLRTIQLINSNLKVKTTILGALLTMYDRKSRLHRAVAKEIRRKFPGYVFEAVIPRNVSLAEAPSFGKTILEYAPYSHGAKAYRQLAEEVLRMEGLRK
ncbi:MAG: chromosome partitioning protein ParA [Candidatus Sungbacteria bacterium RIFCSPHIGHO2_02_FULL_47_11]|uniref:Chromosome partitioning protein ParA n=1 Tax=Candidatus Sungbacteria bacterium RIFCSPHIGHO2_02_FULL_47_11 TaxID=1802270 RepID=A0A1G2KL33_9BACT|nr:MAG: chromosome partitioning protein ParA [Candidatus Sungbacteria bacterium RIFCSPHIGHO2_02_FULL_47_11]